MSTSFVTVLLIGSILGLYFVTDDVARLVLIVGFTIVFALSIAFTTNARRAEIFGASAAWVQSQPINHMCQMLMSEPGRYAAVLVVFMSSNGIANS